MTLPDDVARIFNALLSAAAKGALALLVGKDAATGETRYIIGAMGRDDGDELFVPFGHLTPGHPRQAILAPLPAPPDPMRH